MPTPVAIKQLDTLALLSKMLAMTREQFLEAINRYIDTHQISAREFSRQATGDAGFVSRLRHGANITLKTMEKVMGFMAKHKDKMLA